MGVKHGLSINKTQKRITAFEMKCYRKVLRISWKEKVRNEEVLRRLDMRTPTLFQNIKKLKLSFFIHINQHETLEKHILKAKVEGKRGRGRPTRTWEQDIETWLETTTTKAGKMAKDRMLYRRKIQEATSSYG